MAKTQIQVTLKGSSIGLANDGSLVINLKDGRQLTFNTGGTYLTDTSGTTTQIGGGGVADFASLTDKTTADIPATNTPTSTALALKAPLASPTFTGTPAAPTPAQDDNSTKISTTAYVDTLGATKSDLGVVGINATDITVSRDLTSTDFDGAVRRINSGGAVAITVPTVASMGLAATAGQLRAIAFQVAGVGIPTFAGKTASTTINGVAGATTVLPLGGAPVRYGFYVLTQLAVGGNDWSLM